MTSNKNSIELEEEIIAALNNRRRAGETRDDTLKRILEETANHVDLNEFVQTLADYGLRFMAVPEDELARGRLWIVGTAPVDAKEDIAEYVAETHAVIINDTAFLSEFQYIGPGEGNRHFHRRIPLRAPDDIPGLNSVAINDGIENMREFVTEGKSPTKSGDETVELQSLVEEFVNAGALAVNVIDEIWKMNQTIELEVYLPAATGFSVCGDYSAVELDGDTYSVRHTFPQDGLATLQRTSLYVSDQWLGAESVSVNEGLENARELVTTVDTYDSTT